LADVLLVSAIMTSEESMKAWTALIHNSTLRVDFGLAPWSCKVPRILVLFYSMNFALCST
jgi:hypothetical protein